MKTIEVDEELYRFIASQTQHIGESASDILRRLLMQSSPLDSVISVSAPVEVQKKGIVVSKDAVRTLLISDEFSVLDKAIDRFLTVLSELYKIDSKAFSEATEVKGRTRVYFADNQDTLIASGKTTKPREINGTPFWVITNTNTNRKRHMVELLMERMGFHHDLTEKVCAAI
ncbi:UNVERIFIED_CONTAM: hypothetical protein GTU68_067088 [Idotea baltica]|nr:hypothetical protein [Idotea baltica]